MPPGRAARAASTLTALGVVDEASATPATTIRSQAAGTPLRAELALRLAHHVDDDYVELKFTKLAIENGFDFVRIYAGSTAPTGFSLTAPAAEPKLLYAATGSTPPPKLVFAAPVFVTFESDGLGNTGRRQCATAASRSSTGSPRRPKKLWRRLTAPVANRALDHCTGESELAVPLEARSTASSRRAPARSRRTARSRARVGDGPRDDDDL